jgi:hypothetical protein
MTTYTLFRATETFRAATHRAAHRALSRRLRVDGPRVLVAQTDDGAEIRASLYDGEDYIVTRDGRTLRSW